MRRRSSRPILALLAAFLGAAMAAADPVGPAAPVERREDASAPGGALLGRWSGSVDLGAGREALVLRVVAEGALLDLPDRGIFGFPLPHVERGAGRLVFSLPGAGAGGDLRFEARLAPGDSLEGSFRGGALGGPFALSRSPEAGKGEPYPVATGRAPTGAPGSGLLPGTLLEPPADGNGLPVVLLLAGAGPLDRDGNNYAVPGRCDSLRALAEALADRGVASLRYDKRGAGEAYALVRREEDLVFADHVLDAVDALRALASDGRFSRVLAAGHGEGALVAAAALADFVGGGLAAGREGDFRLALLCASARTAREEIEDALAGLPAGDRAEAEEIVRRLARGELSPDPRPALADFFRPSIQPYLASSLRYDLAAELARTRLPLLAVQGGRDPLAPPAELERLLAARPDARAVVLPRMGRALKQLGASEDEAYRAYSDPSMPLAEGLADLLASFARGE